MKTILAIIGLVAVIYCVASHQVGSALPPILPKIDPPRPRIVSSHLNPNFSFGADHHYVITVHNEGGDGLLRMVVKELPDKNSTQVLRQWKIDAFVHHGEDHEFDVALTGASILDGSDTFFSAVCSTIND